MVTVLQGLEDPEGGELRGGNARRRATGHSSTDARRLGECFPTSFEPLPSPPKPEQPVTEPLLLAPFRGTNSRRSFIHTH